MRLKGQSRVREFLERLLSKNRIPGALLFYGPKGVGKTVASLDFAKVVLCSSPKPWACGECLSCSYLESTINSILNGDWEQLSRYEEINGKRVFCYLSGEHPDFVYLPPGGSSIKIDQIRALKEFVYVKPALSKRKVAIIDEADTLTREASNALLKVLEEPPLDTHIILIAHSKESLLPTILSRAFQVEFTPLEEEVFYQLLGRQDRELYLSSGGSLTQALEISNKGNIKTLLERFLSGKPEEVFFVSQEVEKLTQEEQELFMDMLEDRIRKLFLEKGLNYDKFEMLIDRVAELKRGLRRGLKLSLGLLSLHALWR